MDLALCGGFGERGRWRRSSACPSPPCPGVALGAMAGATPGRISVISTGPAAMAVPLLSCRTRTPRPRCGPTRLPSSPYSSIFTSVQYSVALLKLHHLRRMNLEERVSAVGLRVIDAVGLLLDFNAQPLGQVAAIERILPLGHGQKNHQRCQQQDSCPKDQHPHSRYGQSHGQFDPPSRNCSRAASRWAKLSPSSLHNRRAVAPDAFSTPAVSSTSWRTFSSTCRAATESNSKSSSRRRRVRTEVPRGCVRQLRKLLRRRAARSPSPAPAAIPSSIAGLAQPLQRHPERAASEVEGPASQRLPPTPTGSSRSEIRRHSRHAGFPALPRRQSAASAPRAAASIPARADSAPINLLENRRLAPAHGPGRSPNRPAPSAAVGSKRSPTPQSACRGARQGADWGTKDSG